MAITLTHGATTLTLPPDLIWTDRFKWAAVEASHEYSTTGALLVDQGARQVGRPVTLAGGEDHAWMPQAQCDALRALANLPGADMTLTLHDGTSLTVIFDHTREAFEADLVVDYADPVGTDWYVPTLRFIEI